MERRHKLATWGGTGISALLFAALTALKAAGFDWTEWGFETVGLVLPAIGIPLLFYVRYFAQNKIPKAFLPLVGVAIATAGELLQAFITGGVFNPVTVAVASWLIDMCYTIAKELVGDGA